MAIGDFAKTGQIGTFSPQELQFLNMLQERGFGLGGVYPEVQAEYDQKQRANTVNAELQSISTIGDFVTMIATDVRSPEANFEPSFLEELGGFPPINRVLRPPMEGFDFRNQLAPGGGLRSELGVFDAQERDGRNSLLEFMRGEGSFVNLAKSSAVDALRTIVEMGMTTGLNTLLPGSSLIAQSYFPDQFRGPPIQRMIVGIGNTIGDFLFGSDRERLDTQFEGFEFMRMTQDKIQEGLEFVRDATGFTGLQALVDRGIKGAQAVGGEVLENMQQALYDLLNIDPGFVDVTTEVRDANALSTLGTMSSREVGEIDSADRLFQTDFGRLGVIQGIGRIRDLVDDIGDFVGMEGGVAQPGHPEFIGPLREGVREEFDESVDLNFRSFLRAGAFASGLSEVDFADSVGLNFDQLGGTARGTNSFIDSIFQGNPR